MISLTKNQKKSVTFALLCIALYAVQVFYGAFKTNTGDEITILGFHNVVHDNEKEMYYPTNMWVDSVSSFEQKIKYLADEGYRSLTLDELYEWTTGEFEIKEKSVVLTFDDGYYASSEVIAPILAKYGYTATTFVVGGSIGREHTWDASKLQYVNKKDMEKQDIMKYASHTYALHEKIEGEFAIDMQTDAQLQQDLNMQKELVDTTYFAYPFGHYNDQVINVLKQNQVKLAFGYHENRKAKRTDSPYTLPRFAITAYTNMETFIAMLNSK